MSQPAQQTAARTRNGHQHQGQAHDELTGAGSRDRQSAGNEPSPPPGRDMDAGWT